MANVKFGGHGRLETLPDKEQNIRQIGKFVIIKWPQKQLAKESD